MKQQYAIHCLDNKGQFKLPFGMLFSYIFMSRYLLFLLMGGISTLLLKKQRLNFELPLLPPVSLLITSMVVVIALVFVFYIWKTVEATEKARPSLDRIKPMLNIIGLMQLALLVYLGLTEHIIFAGLVDFVLLIVTLLYLNLGKTAKGYFSIMHDEAAQAQPAPPKKRRRYNERS